MSLMEHLYELRRRMFWAALAIFLGVVVGFIWFNNGVPAWGISSLGRLLIEPYCAADVPKAYGSTGGCDLLALGPFSGLQLQLKAALMAGLVFSSPGWLYQIWAFVTPALYSKERKYALTFVSAAVVLFSVGAVMAYLVIPQALKVLLGFGGDAVISALEADQYYSFLMTLLIVFGLSFELPLFLIALNLVGVISGAQLAKWRRYAIFGLFVLAALVVPGNDPITMLALALSLTLLYEVSLQFAKFSDKRKRRKVGSGGFEGLGDDEASPDPVAEE
ncbi:twin-arginine translocase subunit TatC [Nakamurella antarctica]|uniref:Sec-independent protein translocase protein TatC n=2 Tax=Nakamurella antarctica TaxID=1902245 RepID=A0A3G8ZRS0_9ACTN|nr:twin-arginine translocase subunit TatC [Nakamurella antarctica]